MRGTPRGCGVVLLLDVARLRRYGRGCRLSGHDCRFTQVSRPFHEAPTVRSALPSTGSRSPAPAQPPTSHPARPHCLTKQSRMQFPADTDRPHARYRMISTFWFQNLKYWWGNCMRLFRCCTRYGALHPISGHYTRSERVQYSLIGCTPLSTTSSIADTLRRRNGRHD